MVLGGCRSFLLLVTTRLLIYLLVFILDRISPRRICCEIMAQSDPSEPFQTLQQVFYSVNIGELKQLRRQRQQERHKFAYLTTKKNSFARFARAFLIFIHFADVLVLSTTWNDLFCSCVDDVRI